MSRLTYKHTFRAACIGYVVQAIVNNLAPLLFIAFQEELGLSRLQITSFITINFLIQLSVDLLSVYFVDKIGYRAAAVLSQSFAAAGLVCMGVLPGVLHSAYAGLLIAVVLCALGGGLLEVIISPIAEALPSDSKSGSMSLLHAAYCWGCVVIIPLSTLYLTVFGRAAWRWLPVLWAIVPLLNLLAFLAVPLCPLLADASQQTPMRRLLCSGTFWVMLVLMVCGGASELAMSQWVSLFAETGLGVSKAMGDLLGPCMFALFMGLGRTYFGKDRGYSLTRIIGCSAALCVVSYLIAVFSPWPLLSLAGCGLCGLAVAIFWPGIFSLSSAAFPTGGTAMFAVLALAGDLGCTFGPSSVGWVSNAAGGSLKAGLLAAVIFPVGILVMLGIYRYKMNRR